MAPWNGPNHVVKDVSATCISEHAVGRVDYRNATHFAVPQCAECCDALVTAAGPFERGCSASSLFVFSAVLLLLSMPAGWHREIKSVRGALAVITEPPDIGPMSFDFVCRLNWV